MVDLVSVAARAATKSGLRISGQRSVSPVVIPTHIPNPLASSDEGGVRAATAIYFNINQLKLPQMLISDVVKIPCPCA